MVKGKNFEIEIKSLLGERKNAEELLEKMKKRDPRMKLLHEFSAHLNHYFVGGDLKELARRTNGKLDVLAQKELEFLSGAKDYSLRTRSSDGKLSLVLKISRDTESSANGTNRVEFETPVKGANIDELDRVVLSAGFQYQAKWSRERKEYQFLDATVTLDKNAGYGYFAEFELMVHDPKEIGPAKERLKDIMDDLGVKELNQTRLERMFHFYNEHWREYYGTEKVFIVN